MSEHVLIWIRKICFELYRGGGRQKSTVLFYKVIIGSYEYYWCIGNPIYALIRPTITTDDDPSVHCISIATFIIVQCYYTIQDYRYIFAL